MSTQGGKGEARRRRDESRPGRRGEKRWPFAQLSNTPQDRSRGGHSVGTLSGDFGVQRTPACATENRRGLAAERAPSIEELDNTAVKRSLPLAFTAMREGGALPSSGSYKTFRCARPPPPTPHPQELHCDSSPTHPGPHLRGEVVAVNASPPPLRAKSGFYLNWSKWA